MSTRPLKEIAAKMEEGPIKTIIHSFPEEITREDLVAKMDVLLPFLQKREG